MSSVTVHTSHVFSTFKQQQTPLQRCRHSSATSFIQPRPLSTLTSSNDTPRVRRTPSSTDRYRCFKHLVYYARTAAHRVSEGYPDGFRSGCGTVTKCSTTMNRNTWPRSKRTDVLRRPRMRSKIPRFPALTPHVTDTAHQTRIQPLWRRPRTRKCDSDSPVPKYPRNTTSPALIKHASDSIDHRPSLLFSVNSTRYSSSRPFSASASLLFGRIQARY